MDASAHTEIILAICLAISELLPLITNTEGNGFLHAFMILMQRLVQQKKEKNDERKTATTAPQEFASPPPSPS